jgi:3-isopropylmalate/(R)-2-methylmalate dehydratase large subunit
MIQPRCLFDKIWEAHVVAAGPGENELIYVDRVLLYEGAVPALQLLRERGVRIRRPRQLLATADHFVPSSGSTSAAAPFVGKALDMIERECREQGILYLGPDDPGQGIVHVIGPESGFVLPGSIVVCGDSHTSTNGALGALAFGIGNTELAHVLATQCLRQRKPKSMRIVIGGALQPGVSSKDLILAVIGRLGTAGGTGYAIEFAGPAVRALGMDARMTMCNMSIEAGARFGLIAPDQTTLEWLAGRRFAPVGPQWDAAAASWLALASDEGAQFDFEMELDADSVDPMVTWGTSPEDVLPVSSSVPDPREAATTDAQREALERKLQYMGLEPNAPLETVTIDRVFIGSCTNSRIEDLRSAAEVLRGRRARVPGLVVPGSQATRRQAEGEGLDRVFTEAGLVWGRPGCSMCCALNGDSAAPRERVASTSNRNFEGRQGPGVRTHLMSPAMVAAAALAGRISDVREVLG